MLESQSVSLRAHGAPKTDPLDAVSIVRAYLGGLAKVVWTPTAQAAERREVFFAHRNAVKDSVRARNRIWAQLNARGLLGDRRRREGTRHGGIDLSRPDALDRLLRLQGWSIAQQARLADDFESYQSAERRRKRLESTIAKTVMDDPATLKLVRLCGIRHLTAFALLAFIDQVGRFAGPKSLVRYLGLDPCVSRSGIGGGNGGLTGAGRADVRALLVEGAKSVLRNGNSPFRRWGVALKMRRGANVAACAVARKMVVAVWHLLKGDYTPLLETDVPDALRHKLAKIATDLGAAAIRAKGFRTNTDYIDSVLKTITTPAIPPPLTA